MSTEARVVLCTVPDAQTGADLARNLVSQKLAACVNMLPGVRSFYTWQGAVEDDAELLLVIKTRAELLAPLRELLSKAHPYDVPEMIALEVAWGDAAYLEWLEDVTRTP